MKNTIQTIFTICVIIFILTGIILVGIQGFSIIARNGDLSIKINNIIKPTMIKFSIVAGILGFINGYIGKKNKED